MKSLRLSKASAVLLSRLNRLLLAMSLMALLAGVTAFGQTTTATLSGVIQDQSGAVLPNVKISARNTETGATRDRDGWRGSLQFHQFGARAIRVAR